jgi:EAL domain-containing protein (putative c-di-GMP-specific phosphodiesterase class I)
MTTKPAPRAGLKRALDQKQLVLFYHPIHELASRRIISAEALLRARRRSGEIRNAAPLTATAEQGPDLYRLDSWSIHQAYADAAEWQADGAPEVRLNVNLSPRELTEKGVSQRLRKLLRGCHGDAHKVNVEITETSYIAQPKQTMHALEQLKKLGVELWLDDFGTGHSSVSHLLHFPLDGIKLPAEFVMPSAGDERARVITRGLIEMAHELGLRVIAEGVETEDQLALLRDAKCEYIQGFLFSKPMPVEELRDALNATPPAPEASAPRARTRRGGGRDRASRSS